MAKMSKNRFRKATKDSYGIISLIAKRLDVARKTIYAYMEKHPELKEELHTERDKIIDHAENKLFKKVQEEDWRAIEFLLKNLGSKRGYAPKTEIEGNLQVGLTAESFREAWKDAKKEQEEGG